MANIRLKIFNGTRSDGRRLCDTCRYGMVTRGAADSQEHVYCSWMDKMVAIAVVECNRFDSTVDPTIEQMEEMAVMLERQPKRLHVGFAQSPEERIVTTKQH